MRIGELAAQGGCDVQTVRFYEREGLLAEPEREPSGYRRYAKRHLQRLQFIRHCRSLDIPLPDIRELLSFAAAPDRSCGQVNALLDEHITTVQFCASRPCGCWKGNCSRCASSAMATRRIHVPSLNRS